MRYSWRRRGDGGGKEEVGNYEPPTPKSPFAFKRLEHRNL